MSGKGKYKRHHVTGSNPRRKTAREHLGKAEPRRLKPPWIDRTLPFDD